MHDSLGPLAKSVPPRAWGMTDREFLEQSPLLADFQSPVLALDRSALDHNVAIMAAWAAARGFELAPHGKTTMAPMLWRALVEAGAWGITLATPWQVQVARANGIDRIILANLLLDPVALRWISTELGNPHFEFMCWVDSAESVAAMEAALEGVELPRPIDVVVELGASGGRTGARSVDAALAAAHAAEASTVVRLVGVGGYEGSLAGDRSEAGLAAVAGYLDALVSMVGSVEWGSRKPIVTAGGSAYFELVAEKLGGLAGEATVILRSGAYQVHDDGFYLGISPFASTELEFRSAMHVWARVLSRPEPGLVVLDAGKRDVPQDLGMPVAQLVDGLSRTESDRAVADSEITRLADQHAYLRVRDSAAIPLGAMVRLGLSHPCTVFDKWSVIPVVDDADSWHAPVTAIVRTHF